MNSSKTDILLYDCLRRKKGSITAKRFFNELCEKTINNLKKYYESISDDEDFREHGFEYREQQIKTFITSALNDITKSSFMQEYPIDRKNSKHKSRSSSGRLDYWANYSNCTFLIELKHGWLQLDWNKYYEENDVQKYIIYNNTLNKFESAITQLKATKDKSQYRYNEELYSLAIIVCPIFVRHKGVGKISKKLIKQDIVDDLFDYWKKESSNIFCCWCLDKKYLYTAKFDGGSRQEYHPAVCFIGRLEKLSRTR